MRTLRAAAWGIFFLDLVILAQLIYEILMQRGEPASQASVRGLAMVLGSGLLGIGIALIVSSRLDSKAGLWVSLLCGSVPLLWVINAILQSIWE